MKVPVKVFDALKWLDELHKAVRGLSEAIDAANNDTNQSITGLAHAGCLVAADIEAQIASIRLVLLSGEQSEAAA